MTTTLTKLDFKEVYITQCPNKDYWYHPLINKNVAVWGEDLNNYWAGMPTTNGMPTSLISKTDAVPVMDPRQHAGGHEFQAPEEPAHQEHENHRTMDQETETTDTINEDGMDTDLLAIVPLPDLSTMDGTTVAEELQLGACRFRRLRIVGALRYEQAMEQLDLKRIGESVIRTVEKLDALREQLKREPLQKDRDNLEQTIGELEDLLNEYEATATATKNFICDLEQAIVFTISGSPDPDPS